MIYINNGIAVYEGILDHREPSFKMVDVTDEPMSKILDSSDEPDSSYKDLDFNEMGLWII